MDAFEKLEVWKRGSALAVDVHRLLTGCRDYSFKDQLFRAALSVPSNIAEGYERGTRKEYIRFLVIAKGSCAELRTQMRIGIEAGILESERAQKCLQEAGEISRMLQAMVNRLQMKTEQV